MIALVHRLDQLFFLALTVAGMPWCSWLLSNRGTAGLRALVQTSGQLRLSVGDAGTVRVAVHNRSRLPRVLCRPRLETGDGLQPAIGQHDQADTLAPGDTALLDASFLATRRGWHHITRARVDTTDLLGVFEFSVAIPNVLLDVLVRPRVLPVSAIPFLRRSFSTPTEEVTAPLSRGSGTEFHALREYVQGDELRRVHWPSTARRQQLTVIEFERDAGAATTIVLDLQKGRHAGSGSEHSLEQAVELAATIAARAIREGSGVRLVAAGATDWSLTPVEGIKDRDAILDRLAIVQADGDTPLDQVAWEYARAIEGSGVIAIVPVLDDAVRRAVERFRQAGTDPLVVVVDASSYGGRLPASSAPPSGRVAVFRRGDDPVAFLEGRQ